MIGYLLVRADWLMCGLPVDAVRRVLDVEEVYTAPPGHRAFLGVIAVDRSMMPLVHLRAVLDRRPDPPASPRTAVVVECGGTLVALGVDDAEAVVREQPDTRPVTWDLPWAASVARRGETLVPVVDLDVLADRLDPTTVSQTR